MFLHALSDIPATIRPPRRMVSPFSDAPHPIAQLAATQLLTRMRSYMQQYPDSELHRLGKMFGVLVVETSPGQYAYLSAFSAMLDGSYHHDGFVPPVFDLSDPNGYFRQEEAAISRINHTISSSSLSAEAVASLQSERRQRSQALQRWMFSHYLMLNERLETADLIDIFRHEKPILSPEEYFAPSSQKPDAVLLPPSGSGECCAPKLFQFAFAHHLRPVALAEFWVGASPKNELRQEGYFYPPCSGRCRPILRHMLSQTEMETSPLSAATDLLTQVSVLFQDDAILVASKPSGLLTVPGTEDVPSLQQYLSDKIGVSCLPVHRLDQDTSGLVILAKTEQAYSLLQEQFRRHKVQKRYLAVLSPRSPESLAESGRITLPLLPNPFDRPRQMVDYEHGKPTCTFYRVLRHMPDNRLLVEFRPETGRTHQLRVHSAHPDGLNAPIVGDRLYGIPADRLMLHAAEITFLHPVTGETLRFLDDKFA